MRPLVVTHGQQCIELVDRLSNLVSGVFDYLLTGDGAAGAVVAGLVGATLGAVAGTGVLRFGATVTFGGWVA